MALKLHEEILTKNQASLLPVVQTFNKNFRLVGGTAIALHLGHRRSIDFDLFSNKPFKNAALRSKIKTLAKIDQEIVNRTGEFTFISRGVKFTFYAYPFDIEYRENFHNVIKMPDLLTLAAMKAHALGGRAKWKDYVDLYFILKDFYKWPEITGKAKELFSSEFNEKLFRIQMTYFDDVSYAEEVEFMPGFEIDQKIIKDKLIEFSLA
ncbi:MAG: nucleotidyl transferase AbiEii/AbiGii toxin family protein [bacterium]|nr:nucleotidyl transferase AbiEii/AbiGii toxin family protein [bacterium]